jgi:signal transduction histidine kinase/integral membrane sensor domain MASE1
LNLPAKEKPMEVASAGQALPDRLESTGRVESRLYSPRIILGAVALATAYFLGVQVGIAFTLQPHAISILWPPNALVLAALLLAPRRTWWLFIVAVLPAHMIAEVSLGVPYAMAFSWYVSNVAEGLLGAWLLLRYLGHAPRLDRVRDVTAFLMIAVLAAPLVTAFLDAGFVALVGWRYTDFWEILRMRIFSNALAELTLVPLILLWFQRAYRSSAWRDANYQIEAAVLLTALCVTSVLVFSRDHSPDTAAVLMYVPLPILMWSALRQGAAEVASCVGIVAAFAIAGVLAHHGPFAGEESQDAALSVQVFLVLVSSTLMLLAASLSELRRAKVLALGQKESLNLALGAAKVGTWEWEIDTGHLSWRMGDGDKQHVFSKSDALTDLLSRVHPEDLCVVTHAVDDMLANRSTHELQFRLLCNENEYLWVSAKGSVLNNDRRRPKRMMGVFIDATQRKLAEMQVRNQKEQLTHLSRVTMLGQLSGALAHELNQPLTSIVINAQAARRILNAGRLELADVDEALADIVAEGRRAGDVISRLRVLFKKEDVKLASVNPNDCIREVLSLEHSDLIMRQVRVELVLDEDLSTVNVDRIHLEQVLLNIIINACQAMESEQPGDRRLRITSSRQNQEVQIQVSDSGPGIKCPESVFEPFFSTKEDGIGLGLAISRTILASYDGRLWAINNADRGATFCISLPNDRGARDGLDEEVSAGGCA